MIYKNIWVEINVNKHELENIEIIKRRYLNFRKEINWSIKIVWWFEKNFWKSP